MGKKSSLNLNILIKCVQKQPRNVKISVAALSLLCCLVAVNLLVEDHTNLFIVSEAIQGLGIMVLIYKLVKTKTCAGLSLRSQELTALFLATRIPGTCVIAHREHTVLAIAGLISTAWVIFLMRFRLKSTCAKEQDNLSARYTLVPAAVLALLIAPNSEHTLINRLWAFSVYLKALSMLPQLHLMQNEKMFEPITAHYVFAIGVARFLGFAFWIVMVYQTGGKFLFLVGYGSLWVLMAFISEIIHTFILADFCYYYVKLKMYDQLLTELRVSP